ncbi:MAG: TIGR03936 family radical SAM-associated protein [Huintestinicola sp.]
MNKVNVRAVFAKQGRAVYISHLDLMRVMQRSLKRSGLPVWYTEGFNPRIYLNFPLALSLGVESECEPMDLAVVEDVSVDEIRDRLNAVLPDGLHIMDCFYPRNNIKELGFAEYDIAFAGTEDISELVESFMAQEVIRVMKFSKKKGETEVDIRPYTDIRESVFRDGAAHITVRLPAGIEMTLNASLFAEAFLRFAAENNVNIEYICTKRTNILCKDGSKFS